MTITTLPADLLATMNTSLDGSGFRVTDAGALVKGACTNLAKVRVVKAGRVQVRDLITDRLYWSGPADDLRSFTRGFWHSA